MDNLKTPLEILQEIIPNFKNEERWNVVMVKDAKNPFGELVLKAIEKYRKQFDITPEQIYNIVTEARKKHPDYENINGEISNEIRKLLKPISYGNDRTSS